MTGDSKEEAGAVVRAARQAAGLTLADLGRSCGYSPSQISRYERGVQPLTDITLLRRFADVLAIPPHALGLAPEQPAPRHTTQGLEDRRPHGYGPTSDPECLREGDDPVRRRELLTGAAGLAGAAVLGGTARSHPHPPADPARDLATVLYSSPAARSAPLAAVRTAVTQARQDFQAARYSRLTRTLPALIATAAATRDDAAGQQRGTASTLLATGYIVAANLMVKLNDDPLAWATADRALQAAQTGDDPLTLAQARRTVAIVLWRTGHPAQARDLLISATQAIAPGPRPTSAQLSAYGTLLQVAAYTAAVDGNRHAAATYIAEAADTATRLSTETTSKRTSFGSPSVVLYQVSIAQVLGDNGTAIEHARRLHPAAIPTPERHGRYWIDVARAYHQWCKPDPCYRALLAAEQAAPAEVRYRPPVHRMTEDLLHNSRNHALPGLRTFARRIGLPSD